MRVITRISLVFLLCAVSIVSVVAAQDSADCPGAPAPRLVIAETGRVLPGDPNNMRDLPARSGGLVGAIAGGDVFTVLEGPVCADGFNWWLVDYNGLIAWTVEGAGDEYWIEPYDPNPPSAPVLPAVKFESLHPVINVLAAGVRARVISDDRNTDDITLLVRSDPGSSARVVANLAANDVVTILDGPVDADSLFWWQIETAEGRQGWVVEALPNADTGKMERTLLAECPATENRIAFSIERYFYTANTDGSELCLLDKVRLPEVHTFYNYTAYFPNKLVWSPDRSQFMFIDFAETRPDGSLQDLFILSVDGLTRRQVTVSSNVIWADWSPDGQRILLTQSLEGRGEPQVWTMRVDGSAYGALTSGNTRKLWAYWLADSETVLYVENIGLLPSQMGPTPQEYIFYTVNVLRGGLKEVFRTANNVGGVRLSPNRSSLIIPSTVLLPEDGAPDFYKYGASEAVLLDLTTGETTPLDTEIPIGTFLPDGSHTFLLNAQTDEITLRSLETGELTLIPLSQPVNSSLQLLDWSPDGRYLLFDLGDKYWTTAETSLLAIDMTDGTVTTLLDNVHAGD